jgi:hypothetical protein
LDNIELIWTLTQDWEEHWDLWKSGAFNVLETKEMEELCNSIYKKLLKLSKELKVSCKGSTCTGN